ncbi:MAG: xylose isomerase [Bacteroidetes bacterium QS_3_64_15]|nr:MAG: xylose isomerase [Bacteroidetes bacterium QS_3_64_15]
MPLPDLRDQAEPYVPDERLEHLRTFDLDLTFTAGIWYFTPSDSRFHDKYKPDRSIEERLEMAAPLRDDGLVGLEAHYPNEINEENLDLWQDFADDTGIRIVTVIPLLFYDEDFEFGSLSNPDDAVRDKAIGRLKRSLELNKELGTDFCVVWPGIDGVEKSFGADFMQMRAFEPKPYEPRGTILFPTTPEGVLLGRQVESMLEADVNRDLLAEGHSLVGMNPEVGHVHMGYEDLAYAFSWPLSEGRLAHTHWNSQPLGNYDQDQNVGAISPEQAEALLYLLKLHGYQGHFGLDINPERMPVTTALRISMDALRAMNDRVNALDHEAILEARQNPSDHRGRIEALLVQARAPRSERLSATEEIARGGSDG